MWHILCEVCKQNIFSLANSCLVVCFLNFVGISQVLIGILGMKVLRCTTVILWTVLLVCIAPKVKADILILVDNQQLQGRLTFIGDNYIEFKIEQSPGEYEWVKVYKKNLLAVVSNKGKIIYPRDKYDENAMNFGKVRLRNKQEAEIYRDRKEQNKKAQIECEKREKNKYKVAAVVGSFGSIMLLTFLNNI